jgi:nucleotide-binding universal stress UspA family protein
MTPTAIVSYDDTLNDHDALTLGRVLADAGASLMLAYVRHTTQRERAREELDQHDADALLERGARWLGNLDVEHRIVVSGSTGEGLRRLAVQEDADIVVFGSDYRTAAGHVAPQQSAQTLLEGGPAAVAIAPANYRALRQPQIRRIGILAGPGDHAALSTARGLAERLGATLTAGERNVDLLIVGSRAEAPEGRVMVSAQAQNAIENSTAPVLIVPRGVTLDFHAQIAVY